MAPFYLNNWISTFLHKYQCFFKVDFRCFCFGFFFRVCFSVLTLQSVENLALQTSLWNGFSSICVFMESVLNQQKVLLFKYYSGRALLQCMFLLYAVLNQQKLALQTYSCVCFHVLGVQLTKKLALQSSQCKRFSPVYVFVYSVSD